MSDHLIRVEVRRFDSPQRWQAKSGTVYATKYLLRAECSCGWESDEHPERFVVKGAAHRHLVAVGVKVRRKSSTPRDGRRSKVYAAEAAAFGSRARGACYSSSAEAQAVLDRWMETAWWQARFGSRPIDVISRTSGSSTGDRVHRVINLARNHWNPIVLAHEAAHVVQPQHTAGHGKEWCGIYLALLERFVDPDLAVGLRAEFIARKIPHRWSPKPEREVVTKAARESARRQRDAEERSRILGSTPLAVQVLRAHAAAGTFGPAGSKQRRAALDIARHLDQGRNT